MRAARNAAASRRQRRSSLGFRKPGRVPEHRCRRAGSHLAKVERVAVEDMGRASDHASGLGGHGQGEELHDDQRAHERPDHAHGRLARALIMARSRIPGPPPAHSPSRGRTAPPSAEPRHHGLAPAAGALPLRPGAEPRGVDGGPGGPETPAGRRRPRRAVWQHATSMLPDGRPLLTSRLLSWHMLAAGSRTAGGDHVTNPSHA